MAGEDTVVTPHTDTARQAEQVADAQKSAGANRIPAGETDLATATIGDVDSGPQPGLAPNAQPDAPQPKLPTVRSLNDEKRAAITAKWRTDRNEEATGGDDADALASTVRSAGLPPEFAQQAEPAPQPQPEPEPEPEVAAAEPEPQPADSPPVENPSPQQKYKIKVRGEEKEVSHEELIALARKAAAADDYLDEAKAKLNDVNTLLRETKNRAARPAQGQPQADPSQTQPTGNPPDPMQVQPQDDPFGKLVETIQFGDPEEAKQLLQKTIGMTTAQMVQAGLQQARFRDEGARAAKTVKDFEAAHPDIAKDSKARAAIEQDIYDQQRADLDEIGVDPNTLRQDGLPATSADIAQAHRWFRVEQGMTSLKTPQQMLETAHDNFLEWKGIKKATPAVPTPTTPTSQPRVAPVVHVDRTVRRQAIPQQPSPTATPRPAPAPAPAPQTMDGRRSSIVQAMKGQRSKLRGSVGVQ